MLVQFLAWLMGGKNAMEDEWESVEVEMEDMVNGGNMM